MSELDKFFPREPEDNEASVDKADENETYTPEFRTNWPHAEERLRPLLDTWDAAHGFINWSPFERKRILASARAFAEVTEDAGVLRDAVSYMQSRGLDMKDLRSCITVARRLLRKKGNSGYDLGRYSAILEAQDAAKRRRYKEGLE